MSAFTRRAAPASRRSRDRRWRRRRRRRFVDGLLGRERGDRERHRHPVIAARVGGPAAGRADPADGPRTTKPSGRSSASIPRPRKPATSAAMRSLSLTRSSRGAADRDLAAVRRERGDRRQLVDEPGHFRRRDLDRAGAIALDRRSVPRGSPASVAVDVDVARARRSAAARRAAPVRVGFRPTSSISTRDPGSAAAATIQNAADEKSPGTRRASGPAGAGRRRPRRSARRRGRAPPKAVERPLGVIARRGRSRRRWSCRRRAGRRGARRS